MFAHGHHSMMGSEEDPKDGGKVAAAVFGAVGVYGVRQSAIQGGEEKANVVVNFVGFSPFLRQPSFPAPETESAGRDSVAVSAWYGSWNYGLSAYTSDVRRIE